MDLQTLSITMRRGFLFTEARSDRDEKFKQNIGQLNKGELRFQQELQGGIMSQHRSERETELDRKRRRHAKNLKLRVRELKSPPKKK